MKLTDELKFDLGLEGYTDLREIEGKGIVGVCRFAFTVAIVYGITECCYDGRYCYPTYYSAFKALQTWDGQTDPTDDEWIKHKGVGIDAGNPKRQTDF